MDPPLSHSRPSSRTRLVPDSSRQLHAHSHLSKEIHPGHSRMSLAGLNPFREDWSSTDRRRVAVFIMSVVVGLASGSNYVYSAYAPQLANQLVISATVVNLIGLAGNFGVYTSGPVWGKIVDSRGQKFPLVAGGLLCLIGYSVTHAFYTHAISLRSSASDSPSYPRLALLLFAMFLTGCGGSAGLTSGVNAVAKSFPDSTRASATGAVLAGFGLSAFLFSGLGQMFWPGDSGGLLGLLAIGTGGPMLVAALVVEPVPQDGAEHLEALLYEHLDQEETPDEVMGAEVVVEDYASPALSRSGSLELSRSVDLTRSMSPGSQTRQARSLERHPHAHFAALPPHLHPQLKAAHARSQSLSSLPPTLLTHSPLDLLYTADFWLLFLILAILCGTGLMYINNAGTVALALAREGKLVYDKEKISAWQSKQVGLVSIWNCAGRILGGVYSDLLKKHFHVRRIWALPLVAFLFIVSQLAALETTRVQSLWMVSSLLGLSYGALFNVMPMLVLEWFGMRHFSQNWGWTAVAPIIGSNSFNVLFGRVYDAHTIGRIGGPPEHGLPSDGGGSDTVDLMKFFKRGGSAIPDDGSHDCLVGEECYGQAFKIATLSCIFAFALSVWASFRRERKSRERRKAIMSGRPPMPISDLDRV